MTNVRHQRVIGPHKTARFSILNLAIALGLAVSLSPVAHADGTISVSSAKIVDFKGWGLMPASHGRQAYNFANGSPAAGEVGWLPATGTAPLPAHTAICDLKFDFARIPLNPTLLKTDNSLDAARMQDLTDHLTLLKNGGIAKYVISNWTPPAHMKLPSRVRWGKYDAANPSTSATTGLKQYLDPAYADGVGYDYADFFVAVLNNIKSAGLTLPTVISIQNEPEITGIYDSCDWVSTPERAATYRAVVKQLRAKLNANGLSSVVLLAPEPADLTAITSLLGTPSSGGFSGLNADTAYRDAIGGFAYHTYAGASNSKDLNAAMAFYAGRTRWMTEASADVIIRSTERPASGNSELNWSLNFARRMAGDFVDLKVEHWFFWRGWHNSSAPDNEHLIYGPRNTPSKTKAYYLFKRLFTSVRPGMRVVSTSTTDPDLRSSNAANVQANSRNQMSAGVDIIAFDSVYSNKTVLLLANRFGSAKTITQISGLKGGNSAQIFRTSSTEDMAYKGDLALSGGISITSLSLPAYSITMVDVMPTALGATSRQTALPSAQSS